jgi:hypothetical protein
MSGDNETQLSSYPSMNRSTRLAIIFGISIGAAVSAWAGPYNIGSTVNVAETGNTPAEGVWINSGTLGTWDVYAGITELSVNGVMTYSFCIDPYQWSSSSTLPYTVASLASAPFENPTTIGMGSNAALIISNLWAENYSPTMSASTAAGLQIAIWETIAAAPGMPSFSLVNPATQSYGVTGMINAAKAAVAAGNPGANLVALSSNGYQDYVVQNVPDSGMTLVLLGFGLAALAIVGRPARQRSASLASRSWRV